MSTQSKKRKASTENRPKKRRQLVLAPKVVVEPILSDASTLIMDSVGDVAQVQVGSAFNDDTFGDNSFMDFELPGAIVSDNESLSSLSGDDGFDEDAPMREDIPIVTHRWEKPEVDALMTAINVNRDALKFHFDGPGGGREVKRQGWRDVVAYVNSTAETHRTVKQCRKKTADYTMRVKGKYNKLRFQVNQTGRGKISKRLAINEVEGKGLDYLREEAVKGIPDIEPIDIGGVKKRPSKTNLALLWSETRDSKPDYDKVQMKREGVPKNYKDKNSRRIARVEKEKRKKENERIQKSERKKERAEARKAKKELKHEMKQKKKERKQSKKEKREKREDLIDDKETRRERRKQRREEREARRQRKAEKKEAREGRKGQKI